MKHSILALLTACTLPHVAPEPRTIVEENWAAVRVDVSCTQSDPFWSDEPSSQDYHAPDLEWSGHTGTGVIISERHVLTAAHIVNCPVIPKIWVTLRNGRRLRAVVERDDAMYGSGADVARLELASLGGFDLGIAPPSLRSPAESGNACAAVVRPYPMPCGETSENRTTVLGMHTVHGDSGAGVYDGRYLIGLVSKGADDGSYTRIAPLSAYWLEGT